MKYSQKSFTVAAGASKAYRDNWDEVFGKKEPVLADRVIGCTECGKPAAQIGEELTEYNKLCKWCKDGE